MLQVSDRPDEQYLTYLIQDENPQLNYEILKECKMPLRIYIEGSQFLDKTTKDGKPMLLISGGQTGRSQLAVLSFSFDKCEVEVVHKTDLPRELYGEGISLIGDKAYELTWRNKKIIEWKLDNPSEDFKLVETHDMD